MKGRICTAIIILIFVFFCTSSLSHAKNALSTQLSTTDIKNKAHNLKISPRLSVDRIYTVRKGDSLNRIAGIFKVSLEELILENNLQSDLIRIGQSLKIPVTYIDSARMEIPKRKLFSIAPSDPSVTEKREQKQILDDVDPPARMRLVEDGFKMIGVRYRYSGGSEKTGFDCSGLVKNLFSKFDIDLPHSSRLQFKKGKKVDRDKLEIGDLVFFSSGGKTPTHVGVYVGNNKFLHAARKARQVIVSDLNKLWYAMRYLGARRMMGLWKEENKAAAENK